MNSGNSSAIVSHLRRSHQPFNEKPAVAQSPSSGDGLSAASSITSHLRQYNSHTRELSNGSTFLLELRLVLDHSEKVGIGHILGWEPDGKSFRVRSIPQFSTLVAPRFFRMLNYESFRLALQACGFYKKFGLTVFCHPNFVRDTSDVSTSSPATKTRKSEPNNITGGLNLPCPIKPIPTRHRPILTGHGAFSSVSKDHRKDSNSLRESQANRRPESGRGVDISASAFESYVPSQLPLSKVAGTQPPSLFVQSGGFDQVRIPCPIQMSGSTRVSASSRIDERSKLSAILKAGFCDSISSKTARNQSNKILVTLREILDCAERHGIDHIISWLPHGKAFKIKKEEDFAKHILPITTDIPNLKNFRRTLDWYGFKRIAKGSDIGALFHPLFERDNPSKCHKKSVAEMKACSWKDSLPEPNFYKSEEESGSVLR